jgi:hypothetical protein
MSKQGVSLTNYNSQSLVDKIRDQHSSSPPIFILCDKCYWCATYVDKTRIPWIITVLNVAPIIAS